MENMLIAYGAKVGCPEEVVYQQRGWVSEDTEKEIHAQAAACGYLNCRFVRTKTK